MSSRPRAAWPLVAVFTAGYLAAYLLPTIVGRLSVYLGLSTAQAGLVGSALLLSSATAGFTLAGRVETYGPRRAARTGLVLAMVGYGCAALAGSVPLVVTGAMIGGFGSGTATAVAAAGIAAQRDPHRTSSLGLLSVSATAGALYLTIPHLGGGHRLPFASIALAALFVWPATARLGGAAPSGPAAPVAGCIAAPPFRSGAGGRNARLVHGAERAVGRQRPDRCGPGRALRGHRRCGVRRRARCGPARGDGRRGAGRQARPGGADRSGHRDHRAEHRAQLVGREPRFVRDRRDPVEHRLPGGPVVSDRPGRLPGRTRPLGGARGLRLIRRSGLRTGPRQRAVRAGRPTRPWA